jgi:hypothetical protein
MSPELSTVLAIIDKRTEGHTLMLEQIARDTRNLENIANSTGRIASSMEMISEKAINALSRKQGFDAKAFLLVAAIVGVLAALTLLTTTDTKLNLHSKDSSISVGE